MVVPGLAEPEGLSDGCGIGTIGPQGGGLGKPQRENARPGRDNASARSAGCASAPSGFQRQPPQRETPVAGIRVSTSVTHASIVVCPAALATETRWWPSLTKCRSPTR